MDVGETFVEELGQLVGGGR